MRVQFSGVGDAKGFDRTIDLDAVPREGDKMTLPDAREFTVRTVVWFPFGYPGENEPTPFVYVVVGNARPV